MTNENKYSNSVRIIEELQNISEAKDQKKEAIETSKKAAGAVLGSVVLNTPIVSSVKEKIESKINKIPFSDNMLIGTNKIGLKLSKTFTENLKTELSADKDNIKVGLSLKF